MHIVCVVCYLYRYLLKMHDHHGCQPYGTVVLGD
jgi:hypothetical protein